MKPSIIKKICIFFKKRKSARKIFIVLVTLSDLNKTSNRAVTVAEQQCFAVMLQKFKLCSH